MIQAFSQAAVHTLYESEFCCCNNIPGAKNIGRKELVQPTFPGTERIAHALVRPPPGVSIVSP